MSFPQKTKFLKRPLGWTDLGSIGSHWEEAEKRQMFHIHSLCGQRIRIGKEENNLFRYCPRCMVKLS